MYNLKIKDYGNGQVQTRLYTHLVHTGKKKSPEYQIKEFEENPFDDNNPVRVVKDFDQFELEHERSLYNSLKRSKNRIYDISRANNWDWFITLTLNQDKVDRYDYDDCVNKVRKWFNNMKNRCETDLKYLLVPEQHKDGAFHFHGLLKDAQGLEFINSGKKDAQGREIYNIGKYKLGWTTATAVDKQEGVTKYITKYTTKSLTENIFGKRKYLNSRNLNMPKETTQILDNKDFTFLHDRLIEECEFFKESVYEVNRECRKIFYYEHVDRSEEM
jgi:hypothetical protein